MAFNCCTYSRKLLRTKKTVCLSLDRDKDSLEDEKRILDSFFKEFSKLSDKTWVVWNHHKPEYGFSAIEDRYRTLGGESRVNLEAIKKLDLPEIISQSIGVRKLDPNGVGALMNLIDLNCTKSKGTQVGAQEASLLKYKEYKRVNISTQNKAIHIEDLALLAHKGNLRIK